MKRVDIYKQNCEATYLWKEAMADYHTNCDHSYAPRLRSCTAWVYHTNNWYFLRSYNTIVAAINRNTGEAVDYLRREYGYTATSAQHIGKFFRDYNAIPARTYRWYSL